jgi:hypothetical protein
MLTLRATTSTGAVVDEPGPDDLAGLLAEVGRSGSGAFLILENHRDRSGQTYLQVVVDHGTYVVEARAGGPQTHVRAQAADLGAVTAVLTAWTAGRRDWRGLLTWAPLLRGRWERRAG